MTHDEAETQPHTPEAAEPGVERQCPYCRAPGLTTGEICAVCGMAPDAVLTEDDGGVE